MKRMRRAHQKKREISVIRPELDPAHIEWSRQHFANLREGENWGLPRSGVAFRKVGNDLVFVERMSYAPQFPRLTKKQLKDKQDEDIVMIFTYFEAAGIHVRGKVDAGFPNMIFLKESDTLH